MRRWIKVLAIVVGVILLLANLVSGPFLRYIIYHPTAVAADHVFDIDRPFEEIFIDVPGGRLCGVYLSTPSPKGVVLFFHGNRATVQRWSQVADHFQSRGYDVFIPDYRGYGKSTGDLSEEVFYSDAQACYDWVGKKWADSLITVYGRSLGSAAASHVAGNNLCRRLILEAPFSSLRDVALAYVPVLPHLLYFSSLFDNKKGLAATRCVVSIIAGRRDKLVPISCTQKLTPFLKPDDELIVIEDGNHQNLRSYPEYLNMLDRSLGPKRSNDFK